MAFIKCSGGGGIILIGTYTGSKSPSVTSVSVDISSYSTDIDKYIVQVISFQNDMHVNNYSGMSVYDNNKTVNLPTPTISNNTLTLNLLTNGNKGQNCSRNNLYWKVNLYYIK